MARFMPRGSIFQFNWQETAEGREFLGGILHRNRRKTFGESSGYLIKWSARSADLRSDLNLLSP